MEKEGKQVVPRPPPPKRNSWLADEPMTANHSILANPMSLCPADLLNASLFQSMEWFWSNFFPVFFQQKKKRRNTRNRKSLPKGNNNNNTTNNNNSNNNNNNKNEFWVFVCKYRGIRLFRPTRRDWVSAKPRLDVETRTGTETQKKNPFLFFSLFFFAKLTSGVQIKMLAKRFEMAGHDC